MGIAPIWAAGCQQLLRLGVSLPTGQIYGGPEGGDGGHQAEPRLVREPRSDAKTIQQAGSLEIAGIIEGKMNGFNA